MLENAKVTLDLQDIDELRANVAELEEIKRAIAKAITVKQKPKGEEFGECFPEVKLSVDKKILEDLIWKYHGYRKEEREWIADVFLKEEVKIEIK